MDVHPSSDEVWILRVNVCWSPHSCLGSAFVVATSPWQQPFLCSCHGFDTNTVHLNGSITGAGSVWPFSAHAEQLGESCWGCLPVTCLLASPPAFCRTSETITTLLAAAGVKTLCQVEKYHRIWNRKPDLSQRSFIQQHMDSMPPALNLGRRINAAAPHHRLITPAVTGISQQSKAWKQ